MPCCARSVGKLKVLVHGPHKSSHNAGMLDEKGSRNEQALANSRTAATVLAPLADAKKAKQAAEAKQTAEAKQEAKKSAEPKRGGLKGGGGARGEGVENRAVNGGHAAPSPRDETQEKHGLSGGASLLDALKSLVYGLCFVY